MGGRSLVLSLSLFLSGCMSVLYSPRVGPVVFFPPEKFGYKPLDAEIAISSGERIHGWWLPSKIGPSRGLLVHFHGNAENLTSHYAMMAWVTDAGYDYFIFDYPGYGLSSGEPTAQNTVESGAAVLRWLHEKIDSRPLIVYGQSLGGAIAQKSVVDVKSEVPFCDLVLDSTFSSYKGVTRGKLATMWWTWPLQPLAYFLMSDRFAADPKDLHGPVLVIHGEQDPIVEFPNGEKLFGALNEPKEFWRLPHGAHGGSFRINGQEMRAKLLDRLAKTCPPVP